MPQVVQFGQINTTALSVADVYVQIVAPQFLINGIPTNIIGVVGTAAWGPVSAPTPIGPYNDYARQFGNMVARTFDMGTQVWTASLQGGQAYFMCVRVTDGTDAAATIVVQTNCVTFTSKFTGSLGNSATVTISTGTAASTKRVVVTMPGQVPEQFDNVSGTGNALWVNIANAINLGQSGLRGPSNFITATAGVGATAPTNATYTLTGGSDGATTITGTVLVGVDTTPRSGMYALRGVGCSIGLLADCTDPTTWPSQVAFGLGEGIYMMGCGAAGESITTAAANKATAGIDSYAFKLMLGDWIYFLDTVNGQTRMVSPQGFAAGRLGNLSPAESSLNKPIYGVVGTQKSRTSVVYSSAELSVLATAGIDVICNPIPAGSIFGCRNGRNTSSNAAIHGDNYTRMTNYIAFTIARGIGYYIGQLQTVDERRRAKITLDSFFANLQQQGLIGNVSGGDAFQVKLDNDNNPFNRVALGYQQADVKVTYLSVVEFFIVNIEGGQTVSIDRTFQPTASFAA